MDHLSVFCDSGFAEAAERRLREGIAPHSLLLPEKPGESVLAEATRDPLFDRAEIAFGQPSVESVLGSSHLRWLQITSAGFTRYDTPEFRAAAKNRGLVVTNSSSVFAEPCAEHLFAFMLAQARQLPTTLHARGPGGAAWWLDLRQGCFCLEGQHVVILGFGAIGRRLAELLTPLRMKVTAMRRNPSGAEGIRVVDPSQIAPVLATADHVINILPANADSRYFFSAERFGQMKTGAIFYNIGRGSTVDQPALVDALQRGHLGAAWLDVTDPEPLRESDPLWSAPRCYITPHLAGGHHDEEGSLVAHFLCNFQHFIAGAPLINRIM